MYLSSSSFRGSLAVLGYFTQSRDKCCFLSKVHGGPSMPLLPISGPFGGAVIFSGGIVFVRLPFPSQFLFFA